MSFGWRLTSTKEAFVLSMVYNMVTFAPKTNLVWFQAPAGGWVSATRATPSASKLARLG
jgi:hypothetical protein